MYVSYRMTGRDLDIYQSNICSLYTFLTVNYVAGLFVKKYKTFHSTNVYVRMKVPMFLAQVDHYKVKIPDELLKMYVLAPALKFRVPRDQLEICIAEFHWRTAYVGYVTRFSVIIYLAPQNSDTCLINLRI